MKRVLSIFMGLMIAALCLFSIDEKQTNLSVEEVENTHKDDILHQVKTVNEWYKSVKLDPILSKYQTLL